MTASTTSSDGSQGFYGGPVYADDLDYRTVEDAEPLPSLNAAVQLAAGLAMSCVAAIAAAGVVTLTPGAFMASAYSEPVAIAVEDQAGDGTEQGPLDLRLMTERMHQRAGLATRLFQRTPHPGIDEPDPDYDF